MTTLPGTERRVLVLRANPGAAKPRSRAWVAGYLKMSVAHVSAVEHRALADLGHAGRTGACVGSGGAVVPAAFVLFGAGSDTALPIRGDVQSTLHQRADAIASAALRGAPVKVPSSPHAVAASTGTPLPAPGASAATAAHRRAPGSEAGSTLPKWVAIPLLGVLALALIAFVAFEVWDATLSRRRWQYRRYLRQRPKPLAPVARAHSARESQEAEPETAAPPVAAAGDDRPSRRHRDQPPRRRRRGAHDRSLRS